MLSHTPLLPAHRSKSGTRPEYPKKEDLAGSLARSDSSTLNQEGEGGWLVTLAARRDTLLKARNNSASLQLPPSYLGCAEGPTVERARRGKRGRGLRKEGPFHSDIPSERVCDAIQYSSVVSKGRRGESGSEVSVPRLSPRSCAYSCGPTIRSAACFHR